MILKPYLTGGGRVGYTGAGLYEGGGGGGIEP